MPFYRRGTLHKEWLTLRIDEAKPGCKHILIQPQPGGGFTTVKASHQTMYGTVSPAWTLKDGRFELGIKVPANTRATVRLPKAQLAHVTETGKALANGNVIMGARQDGEFAVVNVGSGQYQFSYLIGK